MRLQTCLLVASVAAGAGVAVAQTPDTVFLEELTWMEVRDKIAAGTTTIIVPTAGTEQKGPHGVLGEHRFIVNHAADRIARRLGNALVAPAVVFVPEGGLAPPTGHMRYAGTITLPTRALHGHPRIHGPESRGPRLHRHRVHRRQRWQPARHGDGCADAQRGMGRREHAGPLRRRLLCRPWVARLADRRGRDRGDDRRSRRNQRHVADPVRGAGTRPYGQAGAGRRVRGQRRVR